jgi:type II secretory pathway pseudopilin PulG
VTEETMRHERGIAVVEVVILLVVVGLVASIAVPAWLRARVSANESAVIGDTRTVITAQATYAAANANMYDSDLSCLAEPSRCIPGYAPSAPAFLEPDLARQRYLKQGYRRSFSGLCSGSSGECQLVDECGNEISSKTSADTYTFVGAPERPGKTGIRAFCADDTGVICYEENGNATNLVGKEGQQCKAGCNAMC